MAGNWEWLRGLQPSSEVPEQLCTPTASPELNLGVQVIGSNIAGNDVVELAAQYMVEHARLEVWMGSHEQPLGFWQHGGGGGRSQRGGLRGGLLGGERVG
ncbi:hypothetical protein [Streptomyces mirabilis]|uniref:hypothetical protein n=1 Tax=Streptomyces mirabilis TaxID=68239 RepID=UPI0036C56D84